MKKLFFIALLLPAVALAQKGKTVKAKPKAPVKKTQQVVGIEPITEDKISTRTVLPVPVDGYSVAGTVTGIPDGTGIYFLNEQMGMLDEQAKVLGGKFSFSGKVVEPTLKQVYFGMNSQPFQLFLDNSTINITADAASLNKATVSGSPTHSEFTNFVNTIGPLQQALANEGDSYDTVTRKLLTDILIDYVRQHPASYVTPVALVVLQNTSPEQENTIAELYNLLGPNIKYNPYSSYVAQRVAAAQQIPLGTTISDFSQNDSTGKAVSLSSFRGKYVLVDFWASWCRPCRQENPNVVAAYNKFSTKNFTILGVSFDQTKPAWINAIAVDGLNWSHVSDLQGWGNAVGQQLGIRSIPQNLLISPEGKVIGKNLRGKNLVRKLNEVLN